MNSFTIGDLVTIGPETEGALLAERYRIVRQLGQGGMGSVWLAEDTQLDNKQFAIKMLPSILVSNKRAYRQLKDEALVAMQLVHPNIVQIRAFEENDGNPFLVMDYIDGVTLDDYLADCCGDVLTQRRRDAEGGSRVSTCAEATVDKERVERVEGDSGRDARPARPSGGLPEDEVVRLLTPIAAALDCAHSKGVVHRDVKPGNVMIAKDGTPYILDFGIAREIQETMTRVTGKLSSGTLFYMSPEQLNGAQPNPAQDVYSFAAMVYECLTGEPPFSRGNIEFQIMNKRPKPLSPHIAISGLVMQGLAKKPVFRPKTCAAVLEGNGFTQRLRDAEVAVFRQEGGTPEEGQGKTNADTVLVEELAAAPSQPSSPSHGFGTAVAVLAILAALAGGVWWMKDGTKETKGTDGTDSPPVASVPGVASVPKPKPVAKPATNDVGQAKEEAERRAKEEQEKAAEFGGLKTRISTKVAAAKEKMERINAFRADSEGLAVHIESADVQWKTIDAIATPNNLEEAKAAFGIADKAEALIALDLDWLVRNKAGRDAAKATESQIAAMLAGDIAAFKAERYAAKAFGEGNDLRMKGKQAFAKGDFAEAGRLLGEAKAKLAEAARDAKASLVRTTLESAQKYASGEKWQQCIAECDKVLDWDPSNAEAKRMKESIEPVASVSFLVDGVALGPGEFVSVSGNRWKTPVVWGSKNIKAGKTYGGEVVYEKEDRRYVGRLENFKVDWQGNRNFEVVLKRTDSLDVDKKSNEAPQHKDKVQLWEGGPYWADRNIGAENPWDYGYYFWWGDPVGYKRENNKWVATDGSSANFSFTDNNTPTCGKDIGTLRSEGWITADNVLSAEHDAAQVQWGGEWRMPTKQEIDDLCKKCDWTWTTMEGVRGYIVRGRGGYASARVFLPCAGYGSGTLLDYAGSSGFFWSSVPRSGSYDAWDLYFDSSDHSTSSYDRRNLGQPVRPVQGFTK